MSTVPPDQLLTTHRKLTAGQVAELFGVRIETVRRWSDAGKIRCTRTLGGDRRYDAEHVRQLLDAG